MPLGNSRGYGRNGYSNGNGRGTSRRAARGNGGLVAALQSVLARYAPSGAGAGGGRRGAGGRLGKGPRAAAKGRAYSVGDNGDASFERDIYGNNEDFEEADYRQDASPLRIGHRW